MRHNIMKGMAWFCAILCASCMSVILYLSMNKTIVISEVAQDEMVEDTQDDMEDVQGQEQEQEQEKGTEADGNVLTFVLGKSDTSYLRVPLPEECGAEDIVIENHYMDQELCVIVNDAEESFYVDHAISGNRDMVRQGIYEETREGIRLTFHLTGIFECHTILENNDLYISFLNPREVYDRIVVIDPAWGGKNTGVSVGGLLEKDINLNVAKKLKEKLDKTDIKAYYTRMDDVYPDEESRVQLANETRADMYIRIQADFNEDSSVYGTTALYNGDYFIPGFGSVELADALEREVVTSIKGKALGLSEASANDYALRNVTVPAAAVKSGCITNKQEAILLGREDYQEKIAEGIYQAIIKIYEGNFQ